MSDWTIIIAGIFWASSLLLSWVFVAYPVILLLLRRIIPRAQVQQAPHLPTVTVIVPTYQEAKVIERRIANLLEADYPPDRLEVMIVDSGSTDGTAQVVGKLMLQKPERSIRLIEEDERRGLVPAVNLALQSAQGEIIIKTDGPTLFEAGAIRQVTRNFADPRVGAVTGRFGFPTRDTSVHQSEGMAWDFKNALRQLEGAVDSTSFVSGELCAFRKDLIDNLGNASADDSYVAYRTRELGYRVIAEPQAIYYEKKPSTFKELQAQKTKSAQVGMIEAWRFRRMLFNPRYGLFGCLIFPTKLLFAPLSPFLLALSAVTGLLWLVVRWGWLALPGLVGVVAVAALLVKLLTGRNIARAGATFLFNEWVILRAFLKSVSSTFDPRWEKASSVRED